MNQNDNKVIYLKDYQVSDYVIDTTNLEFDLYEDHAAVKASLDVRRHEKKQSAKFPDLVLNGIDIELISVFLDGRQLSVEEYQTNEMELIIPISQNKFHLCIHNKIYPQKNTSLEGLYKSKGMFCTQCEAEGFRKITYYLDRPDVMSRFTTKICADEKRYPVLLSNGNAVKSGKLDAGRHWVQWEDPFCKPCYLFALVAGELNHISDHYRTKSGRDVSLKIYTEPHNISQCDFAMASLKKAMKWDEDVYGREYDLDVFMIVAVDHFNMGAMENKGLNIFNSACVLASKETATDSRFERIEGVVAHEYFHNWSGNRVTCRDWFQLSLKEGFTVFRDSEFSADMHFRDVKRIEDADIMRTLQFAEDSGPMSHPVQPDSYMEISNFYTLTVYEKGAEVVRMIHTLLGKEKFRKGSDLFFDRFDGQAVTCEDFVKTMEDASHKDLKQFRLWYSQSGTPQLQVKDSYDPDTYQYDITITQSCPDTPGQTDKKDFHIPFKMGLLGNNGQMLPLNDDGSTEKLLELVHKEEIYSFDLSQSKHCLSHNNKPVPSLLRAFTAPVRIKYPYSKQDRAFLISYDTDNFVRWDACQELAMQAINEQIIRLQNGESVFVDEQVVNVFGDILSDSRLEDAIKAKLLLLPSEEAIAEQSDYILPRLIDQVRYAVKQKIAKQHQDILFGLWKKLSVDKLYRINSHDMGERSLKNVCLGYLVSLDNEKYFSLAMEQYQNVSNMTDKFSALSCLINSEYDDEKTSNSALENFLDQYRKDANVVNQWFSVQSSSRKIGTLEKIQSLSQHELFDVLNPNRLRSLYGAFSHNMLNFHREDMSGYVYLGDIVLQLDEKNPQIAARLVQPLTQWRRYDDRNSQAMKAVLMNMQDAGSLSSDLNEVVLKSLA